MKPKVTKTIQMPRMELLASVTPQTVDSEARTVDVQFYTGARVRRYNWRTDEEFLLEFSLEPGDVRLERANGGAPVLNSHSDWSLRDVIGVIENARVDGERGTATLRFSSREDVEPIWRDVQDGILPNVSMGAEIFRMEDISEDDDKLKTYRAVDWELGEISFVPINADPDAQTLSEDKPRTNPCAVLTKGGEVPPASKEKDMSKKLARRLGDAIEGQVSDSLAREGVIEALASRAGLTAEQVEAFLSDEAAPAKVALSVLEAFAIELSIETKDLHADAEADGVTVELAKPAPRRPEPARDPEPEPTPEPGAEVVPLSRVREIVKQTQAEERQRAASIREDCRRAGLSSEFADGLVAEELSRAEVVDRILDERLRVDNAADTRSHISLGRGEGEKVGEAIETSLLHRYQPDKYKLEDNGAGDFRGMTLLEIGRWCAERAGHPTRGKSRMDLARLALHSTSDFPQILANVANKTLRRGYEESPRTWGPIARQVNAGDFKPISRVQLGEAPTLEKVGESGEFRRGSISEGAETYKVETYGKVIGITRQVIVNDDLNAFTRVPFLFGRSAARKESDIIWGIFIANGQMADGNALFSAAHANLAASGGAIGTNTLDAGTAAIAKQKGLEGEAHLNLEGSYLIVPVALKATAMKHVGELAKARVVATKSADIPVFADDLEVIAEPRLDDDSESSWYLGASPGQVDMIEYAYLDGQEGVAIETREGFDVDGVEVKARLDFGAGVVDFRGFYKNPGA